MANRRRRPGLSDAPDGEMEWTRLAGHLEVQGQVGAAWVHLARVDGSYETAKAEAERALSDSSVRAVRILEHTITHRCDRLLEVADDVLRKPPPKMQDTGERVDCAACGHDRALVSDDGVHRWAACPRCERTLPV